MSPRPRGPSASDATGPSLAVRGLEKHFGSVRANDGVDAEFRAGEIHGLLGENGAGKSTLVKILAGVHRADGGTISIGGRALSIGHPAHARAQGIEVVHQHSTLIPALSVLENVSLIDGGLGRVDPALVNRLAEAAGRLGFSVDPNAPVAVLSPGARQRVEIARALMRDAHFLILDEPTAVLAPTERDQLFALLRRIADSGTGVVLVTHRLDEVLTECDALTVMRQGRVVGISSTPSDMTETELIRMLVGELQHFERHPRPPGRILVEAAGLRGAPPRGRALRSVSLTVHEGEILGVAGVEGNGQAELAAALVGAWQPDEGEVAFDGRPVRDYPAAERIALIADVPDDEEVALVNDMTVWENLALSALAWKDALTPRERRRHRERAEQLVREFEIKTASIDTTLGRLSGGNRRRVLLARELSKGPRLVVSSYASRGLDVRSADQVKRWIGKLADAGAAVVYIAAELDDLMEIADRIAVMAGGRITGVLAVQDATAEGLGQLMLSQTATRKERVA